MVDYELLRSEGLLVIRPRAALEAGDFQRIAVEVDPYIEANGQLHGVMIEATSFPGWKDFAALLAHLRFVKDHHRKIAIVSDSEFFAIAPQIASHFLRADIRNFPHDELPQAMSWLRGTNP